MKLHFLSPPKILDVYNIKNDIPLFLIKYRELRPIEGQALSDLISLFKTNDDPIIVNMSDLERYAMLKLFQKNAKRLHSKYQEKNEGDKINPKAGFQASFVLPLCPIGMRDLGKLTKDPGCEVCGKKNISRCAQCLTVSYCGKCKCQIHSPRVFFCLSVILYSLSGSGLEEPQNSLPFP